MRRNIGGKIFTQKNSRGKITCWGGINIKIIRKLFHPLFLGENDNKMTLEFELDKMGSPISTWTNKAQSPICPNEVYAKWQNNPSLSSLL